MAKISKVELFFMLGLYARIFFFGREIIHPCDRDKTFPR